MTRLSVGWRLPCLIALILVITIGTAGLFKASMELALPGPSWLQEAVRWQEPSDESSSQSYDLGRSVRRFMLIVAIAVFAFFRRSLPWSTFARRGLQDSNKRSHLALALSVSLIVVCLYFFILGIAGYVSWTPPPWPRLIAKTVEYLLGAIFVGLLEELLFRGAVFRAMLTDWGPCRAIVGSSALFAALHCISGGYRVETGWDPFVGIRLFQTYFNDSVGDFAPETRLMFGLFLFGALLAYLYLKTGSLWAPIGAHAGLVFVSRLSKQLTTRSSEIPDWFYGDRLFIVSGVLVWVVLGLLLLAAARWAPAGPLYRRIRRRR